MKLRSVALRRRSIRGEETRRALAPIHADLQLAASAPLDPQQKSPSVTSKVDHLTTSGSSHPSKNSHRLFTKTIQ